MIVTAWNNGNHHPTGAGYGLKLSISDSNFFNRNWEHVTLHLEGEVDPINVNIAKDSFWTSTCRELISKDIGLWLKNHGKIPWSKGYPPKLKMEHLGGNSFKVYL